ncbi:MAG: NfeD family protein [Acidimicrobiales bacterium]
MALAVVLPALLAASPAVASPAAPAKVRIDIVKVSGLIDPINADLLARSLRSAAREHAVLLVWQLNSSGGTVSAARIRELADGAKHSTTPVAVWIGGSGRPRSLGEAWTLARSADFVGEAPGSRVGNGPPPPGAAPDGLEHRTISGDDAADQHLIDEGAPTLVSFLGDLSGHTIKGTRLDLGTHGFRKDAQFAFSQLSVVPKLFHTAASPNVAFVMLMIAMAMVVFEFFTAGVGVAAGTAVIFGVLAAYGLHVLPVHIYAVVLLVLSVLGFAIDVQAGAPRFWTLVGVAAFVGGALELYDGYAVAPWVVASMGVLLGLFMIGGMPAMVRSRFSTPTIGRESMVGTTGVAVSMLSPEGTVRVNGAPWRARTNRATPIDPGDAVRVVAIDGLLLEVEPAPASA